MSPFEIVVPKGMYRNKSKYVPMYAQRTPVFAFCILFSYQFAYRFFKFFNILLRSPG